MKIPCRIPFNRPTVTPGAQKLLMDCLSGGHHSGDGLYTQACRQLLEKEMGVPRVLLTTSCTHALEMSALLLDIQQGDEVIVPSFTFVSTVNAFVLRGAKPIFCDVRPDTLNMDEKHVSRLISERTKAIVPVHYAGVACEMDDITALAKRAGCAIVEDNAHGIFGRYKGRYLGTFGALATQSFHETKNFSSGEGGALLINDTSMMERAEILREKGTNRAKFFRGQVDKYTWVDLGSSFLPSDLLAALLLGQLEARSEIQQYRARIWQTYRDGLADWAVQNGASLPVTPDHCEQAYHMFYLLMPDLASRQRLIAHLRQQGILAVFHYVPLHLSPMGLKHGGFPGACPVTEKRSDQLVRLPFYNTLSLGDQQSVIEAVRAFRV